MTVAVAVAGSAALGGGTAPMSRKCCCHDAKTNASRFLRRGGAPKCNCYGGLQRKSSCVLISN